MATVHHPPLKGVGFQHNASRAWIWLSIVLAVLLIGAIAWSVSSPSVSETATVKTVTSTEFDHEMTPGQIVSPGVTTQYFPVLRQQRRAVPDANASKRLRTRPRGNRWIPCPAARSDNTVLRQQRRAVPGEVDRNTLSDAIGRPRPPITAHMR